MAFHSIGELARRTGLTVKAIRFYADRGIVPATRRTAAGHRVYDDDAAARLDLVRSLRDLGIDLSTIRRILEREVTVADVATAHADALDVTIRALRFRRAVLTVIAAQQPEELAVVHRLAAMSEDERRQLVETFLTDVFADVDGSDGIRRSLTPELPDDPAPAQIDAWVELAALVQDSDFRAYLRRLATQHAADRVPGSVPRPEAVAVVWGTVPPDALLLDAESPAADAVVDAVAAAYARAVDEPDGPALRQRLLDRLELANDPRRERYERLLAVVNGWPASEPAEPALTWCIRALRARRTGE